MVTAQFLRTEHMGLKNISIGLKSAEFLGHKRRNIEKCQCFVIRGTVLSLLPCDMVLLHAVKKTGYHQIASEMLEGVALRRMFSLFFIHFHSENNFTTVCCPILVLPAEFQSVIDPFLGKKWLLYCPSSHQAMTSPPCAYKCTHTHLVC